MNSERMFQWLPIHEFYTRVTEGAGGSEEGSQTGRRIDLPQPLKSRVVNTFTVEI